MTELRDEAVSYRVLESDLVYEGRVWDVRNEKVEYPTGTIERQYVDHPGAAAIVAIDNDERVLLIQQYRHPIQYRDWELPAGLLDVVGEDPLEAAQRELAEEADLAAAHWEPLLSIFPTPGGNDEIIHIFLARELRAIEPFERTHEEADMRLEWVALQEAADAVLAGNFRNGALAAGVLAAARKLQPAG